MNSTAVIPVRSIVYASGVLDRSPCAKGLTIATPGAKPLLCTSCNTSNQASLWKQNGTIVCPNVDCACFAKPIVSGPLPENTTTGAVDVAHGFFFNHKKQTNIEYTCPKDATHEMLFMTLNYMYCRDCDAVKTSCDDCHEIYDISKGYKPYGHQGLCLFAAYCDGCTAQRDMKKKAIENDDILLSRYSVQELKTIADILKLKRKAPMSDSKRKRIYQNINNKKFL